jgi:hypothetical protein
MFNLYIHDLINSENNSIKIESILLIQKSILLQPKLIDLEYILPKIKLFLTSKNDELRLNSFEFLKIFIKIKNENFLKLIEIFNYLGNLLLLLIINFIYNIIIIIIIIK